MPILIEIQEDRNCTIYAINNALQKSFITKEEVEESIRLNFVRFNIENERKNKELLIWKEFYEQETKNGYDMTYVMKVLKNKKIYIAQFPYNESSKPLLDVLLQNEGKWLVNGTYHPNVGHSLAVHNGYIIESIVQIEPRPYK